MNNWVHLMHSSQPVWNGLFNSVIVAAFSAILTTYFSCMTAYAIHVYNFKLKNVMFTFISHDHDDSYTGNCTWFLPLNDGLESDGIPLSH